MLFYMKYNDEEEIKKLPSSYLVINLTKKKRIIPHNNIKNVNFLPDKNDDKEKFEYDIITKYREHLTVLANYLIKATASNSMVIVCSEKLCKKAGFNIPKAVCGIITERYKFKSFKFTYDITTAMIKESKFSKKGLTNLIKDMDSLRKHV